MNLGSPAQLMWGVIFGSIGMAFFIYGKKQKATVPFLAGLGLCVFPYFIANIYAMVGVGACLVALPFFVKV